MCYNSVADIIGLSWFV